MRVEAIGDQMPFGCLRVGRNQLLQVAQKVRLGASRTDARTHDATLSHIKTRNQGLSAMANVFELLALTFGRAHGLGGSGPFEGLNSRHLIG